MNVVSHSMRKHGQCREIQVPQVMKISQFKTDNHINFAVPVPAPTPASVCFILLV